MELAAVFILGRGDVDDAPEFVLAAVITDQHGEQFGNVEGIGFGASGAAIDLDTGGIDDEVPDMNMSEIAMDPEAVAAGFIAREDGGIVGQSEALFGELDLALEGVEVAGGDGAESGFLGHRRGEGEVPGGPAEIESEVEIRRGIQGRIKDVGR